MNKTLMSCLVGLALASTAHAGNLLPPSANDQSPSRLVAAPLPAGDFERQPVSFAWALDPKAALETPAPFLAESREYWAVVEAGEMKAGVAIDTSAPGALIRISPVAMEKSGAVEPAQLRVFKDGRLIDEPRSFQQRANAKQLQDAGMDVPDGSAIVQLDERLGQGRFQLQMPKAGGRYLVHVYEPNSDVVLRAQAQRGRLLAGDVVEVAAQLRQGEAKIGGGQMQGQLVSPSGQAYPLVFAGEKATARLPLDTDPAPGLWEVQLFAGGQAQGGLVQRDARTAIEVSRPTAKLGGAYAFDPAALRFSLPLQVAAPGRYELRATLFATGPSGLAEPVAVAHSANWLESGQRKLDLAFGPDKLPAGYGAPFELRFLELKDQARLGTLDTRELALREAGRPAPVRGRRLER